MRYAVFLSCISLVPSLDLSHEHMHCVISYRICQKTGNSSHFLPYVTVFWKTDHIDTRTEIHLLPVRDRHTHALSRNTKH